VIGPEPDCGDMDGSNEALIVAGCDATGVPEAAVRMLPSLEGQKSRSFEGPEIGLAWSALTRPRKQTFTDRTTTSVECHYRKSASLHFAVL
jgi:hypothetical protein